jgi:hypothetical protein
MTDQVPRLEFEITKIAVRDGFTNHTGEYQSHLWAGALHVHYLSWHIGRGWLNGRPLGTQVWCGARGWLSSFPFMLEEAKIARGGAEMQGRH